MSAKLPAKVVEIANREIGVEEVNGSNCGPQVNEYKAATNLPPKEPWPWCAAFVCWVVKKAMEASEIAESATFRRPRTAGAFDFENWSLNQGSETHTKKNPRDDIKAGDILIFRGQGCKRLYGRDGRGEYGQRRVTRRGRRFPKNAQTLAD
jgi:hypothetical protein